MASDENQSPNGFSWKVETAAVEKKKSEGILFYLLPPMLVAAVFVYCANAEPPAGVMKEAAKQELKVQKAADDALDEEQEDDIY